MPFDPLHIDAGSLRHAITIQAPDTSQADAYGQTTSAWTDVLHTRASVESTTSASYRDAFAQNALAAQSTDLFVIRWPGKAITLKPGFRLIQAGQTYTIQSVDNVQQRNRKVRLACLALNEGSN